MARLRAVISGLHPYLLSSIAGALTVAQIALAFFLRRPGLQALRTAGIVLWWIGVVFAWAPILVLRRRGGVAKGRSYVHTTALVDTGIYAVVRHPQMGTAWLLMCGSLVLITQHWSSLALALPAMALTYLDLLKADERLVEKFGDAYREYMERVPRVNALAGVYRVLRVRLNA
jgi:protein-S-isoprenylcysteine O-methyltransferase Ste14